MQAAAQPIHAEISNQQETLTLAYQTGVAFERDDDLETVKAAFEAALARQEAREIMQGTTLVGPHRDDIKFIVNENDVAVFGSQGQQRTTALAVKLAEIDLMQEETGEYPVLLIDKRISY